MRIRFSWGSRRPLKSRSISRVSKRRSGTRSTGTDYSTRGSIRQPSSTFWRRECWLTRCRISNPGPCSRSSINCLLRRISTLSIESVLSASVSTVMLPKTWQSTSVRTTLMLMKRMPAGHSEGNPASLSSRRSNTLSSLHRSTRSTVQAKRSSESCTSCSRQSWMTPSSAFSWRSPSRSSSSSNDSRRSYWRKKATMVWPLTRGRRKPRSSSRRSENGCSSGRGRRT